MIRLRPPTPGDTGQLSDDNQSVLGAAYEYLQMWTGVLAVTLPFILVIGNQLLNGDVQGSISAYYYTKMHAWFIGIQFALGVFFLSYQYRPLDAHPWDDYKLDNRMANVACLGMLVVALVPTKQPGTSTSFGTVSHIVAAGTVFVLLAVFAFWRFAKTNPNAKMTPRKQTRNKLYKTCGVIIGLSLAVLLVIWITGHAGDDWHPILVFESIATVVFGISWLVKGGFLGILADPPPA